MQVLDTCEALNLLGQNMRVTLVWTRAHVGTVGNERADALAKAGSELESIPVVTPTPVSYMAGILKEKIEGQWFREWTDYQHARQTKQFFSGPYQKISKEILSLSRRGVGHIVRLISGHNNLNYHSHKRDPVNTTSNLCRFCGDSIETFHHFITDCPRFLTQRKDIFLDYAGPQLQWGGWNLEAVLRFAKLPDIMNAVDYDNSIELFPDSNEEE